MTWDDKLFQRHLCTRRFGREFVWFDDVDSTNRWLSENHHRFTMSGATVAADHQTAGRGRYEREWYDARGCALLFSVLLRDRSLRGRVGLLNMLPAIAVADELADVLPNARVGLKWPNDVLLNGRKVAGVLGRLVNDSEPATAVIGVGVNVSQSRSDFPSVLADSATSIAAEDNKPLRREPLLAAMLERWETLYDLFLDGEREQIRVRWERRGPERGQMVTRREGSSVFTGRFAGLGEDGRLRLVDESGALHEFHSGDTYA